MNQKLSVAALTTLITVCLFLSGCSTMDENDVSNFPESSPNHTVSTEPVTLLSAGNESGYYTVEEYNGVNIVTYIDYATLTQLPLCSRPECTHSDSSCTAYALIENMEVPVLAFLENRLVIIQTAPTEASPSKILTCQMDGSDPSTLCEFDSSTTLRSEIYTDAKNLYVLASSVQSNTPVMELLQINLQDGSIATLYTFPENAEAQLVAGFEHKLGLSLAYEDNSTNEVMYALELYNIDSQAMEDPLVNVPFDTNDGFALFGNVLVHVEGQDASSDVTFSNLLTGNVITWTPSTLAQEINMSNSQITIFGLWDDWYRVQFFDSNTGNIVDYHINPSTGEAIPMTLYYENQQNVVLVLAQTSDKILVRAAWDMQQSGGDITSLHPVYALMSRDDYILSNPNYQYITGLDA